MSEKLIRMAVIGTGGRGTGHVGTLASMPDVEVTAVCDLYEDKAINAASVAEKAQGKRPNYYLDYKKVLERADVDAILIATSWTTHIHIAIDAMKAGKYVSCEVGGAASLDECWELVKTSEETGIPCMLLENCSYGREEMALLNMVKKGMFGEMIHCQCGYEHDLREEITKGAELRHYRLNNYRNRNGDIYPTHGLGPMAKILNVNRGNRMITLTAMASKSRGLKEWAKANLGVDHPSSNYDYTQGDVVNTMIKCAHGETILITHDTSLPRPYSRGGRVQGTKGIWMEDNQSIYLDGKSPTHTWEPSENYFKNFDHPLWKEYRTEGIKGGHGGMDWLVLRAFVECVADKTEPPIDVYDMATLMAITVLSEQSIQLGGQPMLIPDFTNGRWLDYSMSQGKGKYALDCVDEKAFKDCYLTNE